LTNRYIYFTTVLRDEIGGGGEGKHKSDGVDDPKLWARRPFRSSAPQISAGGQCFLQVFQNEGDCRQDSPSCLWELRNVFNGQQAQVDQDIDRYHSGDEMDEDVQGSLEHLCPSGLLGLSCEWQCHVAPACMAHL
jgi:hypothetical protein